MGLAFRLLRRRSSGGEQNALSRGIQGPQTESPAVRRNAVDRPRKSGDGTGIFAHSRIVAISSPTDLRSRPTRPEAKHRHGHCSGIPLGAASLRAGRHLRGSPASRRQRPRRHLRAPAVRARGGQGPRRGAGRAAGGGGALPAGLRAAAAAGGGQGAGVQPVAAGPRLREPPHHRADRQRRHAVPGRFDQRRAEPPRDRRAPAGASGAGGAPRPRRRAAGSGGGSRRTGEGRIADAHRDRPPARSRPARRDRRGADPRAGRGAAGRRGLAGDAAGLPRRHRRPRRQPFAAAAPSTRSSCAGSRPTTSPSSATAATATSTIRSSPAACATSSSPARRSASCGATRCGCSKQGWAAARRCRASRAARTTS